MTCVNAAGPLILEGPTGNTPVKYQNPNIVLNFDIGMLTAITTNAEGDALVLNAFSLWNEVTTNLGLSTINLTQGNDISENVDGNNYTTFIPAGIDAPIPPGDGLSPVIYDADGTIIDNFFGGMQSDDIGGFAASIFFEGGSAYIEGFAVINGKDPNVSQLKTIIIIAHEIGHFIGLDHAVVDIDVGSPDTCPAIPGSEYPLMYPIACRTTADLHQDDIISVATLYPSTDINQQLGQITGTFLQTDNTAIPGANIWVQNTTTMEVYSVISDYLANGTGFFSLYLPPGNYTLNANSLNFMFFGSSSVGPHSELVDSASFIAPLNPAISVTYEGNTGATVVLPVIIGEATNVTFKLDGTGTATVGGNTFTPPTPNKPKKEGGGGGGITSAWLLLALTICLRVFRNKRAEY